MTVASDSTSSGSSGNWLFKNKEHGKTSAAASLVCAFVLSHHYSYLWITQILLTILMIVPCVVL